MLLLLAVLACVAGPPAEPAPVPAPVPVPESPVPPSSDLTERLRIPLKTGKTYALLDGEVVMTNGEVDLVKRADGRLFERSHGHLSFTRAGATTEIDFDEGTVFEMWGYRMAVFGGGGDFELSVFPEGMAASP